MKTTRIIFSLSLALSVSAPPASQAAEACAPQGSARYNVNHFTNYAPTQGGINGSCGKSASGRDACQYFLEDYISGKTKAVMIAVPQYDCPPSGVKVRRLKNGKKVRTSCRSRCPGFYNPDMFGGLYRSETFENSLRQHGIQVSCVQLAADDRYATSESCKSKIDVVTRQAQSRLSGIVNSIRGTQMIPIGRSSNILPPERQIYRDPQAVAGLDGYVQPRPVPRRGNRKYFAQPAMPTPEEENSQATAAAAAAIYYDAYEAQRNKALLERDQANTEILKTYENQKKLHQEKK